jgi:hypothetical protein
MAECVDGGAREGEAGGPWGWIAGTTYAILNRLMEVDDERDSNAGGT